MVPACYPSKISSTTGLREAVVFALPSVTGLVRWTDYIPVKLVASADAALEGRTDAGGFIPMDMLSSNTGLMGWVDYLPVYVDNSATDAWAITATGFIPYAPSGGISIPNFYLNLSNASNATILDAQGKGTVTSDIGGVIVGGISVSRLSGVAPLYVNFDYTGTTSSASANPAHECFFATDFGDSGAGVWANGVQSSGLTSKNAGYGPVTGHVYETPGTYHPQVVAIDGAGNTSSRTATIVVQDPNVVYAGAATICISHSGNFTGAPSGATQVNTAGNTDMYAAWNTYKASNKRILFCKANAWTCSAQMSINSLSNVTIDGYGAGVAATFGTGTMVSVTPSATGVEAASSMILIGAGTSDIRICNLRINSVPTRNGIGINETIAGALFYKVEIRGCSGGFDAYMNVVAAPKIMDQLCLYECLVDDLYGYPGVDTPNASASGSIGTPGVFTATGHPFKFGYKVKIEGTPPAPLATGTNYWVSSTSLTANTFTLSATYGGAALALSGTGTCIVRATGISGGIGAFVSIVRGGVMGCYFDSCNHGEQTLRLPYVSRAHINNNYLARPNQGKNVLKLHSFIYDPATIWSEKFVIGANVLDLRGGYSNGEPLGSLSPGNESVATTRVGDCSMIIGNGGNYGIGGEWVRNGIVENNITYAGTGNPRDSRTFVAIGCPNMTVRNNIADFSVVNTTNPYTYTGMYFASIATTTADQTVGVRIYNNTMYSNLANAEFANFVLMTAPSGADPVVDQVTIKNNIWYLPNYAGPNKTAYRNAGGTAKNIVASNNTDNGQTAQTSPNFVASPPVALTDWRPNTGSYAINSGATVPVLRDFNVASRVGGAYDIGAVLP